MTATCRAYLFLALPIFLTTQNVCISGKRIAIWCAPNTKSHRMSVYPLAEGLAARGHEVTVIQESYSPSPINDGPKNVAVYPLYFNDTSCTTWGMLARGSCGSEHNFMDLWKDKFTASMMFYAYEAAAKVCGSLLQNHMEYFEKILNQKWDFIIVSTFFAPCGIAHARLSSAPFALLHASFLENLVSMARGTSVSVVTIPPEFPVQDDWRAFKFWDRLESVWNVLVNKYMFQVSLSGPYRAALSPPVQNPSIVDFYKESRASFVEYPDLFDWVAPIGPEVQNVGTKCTIQGKALDKNLADFVNDKNSKGTILITFGTIVAWEHAPKATLDGFIRLMGNLSEYRIIWKFSKGDIALPDHIKTMDWVPQTDLLLHQKTKLYISHGGIKGVKEAICAGVPAVYVPIFAEQIRNAIAASSRGLGELLEKTQIVNTESAVRFVRHVLNTESYSRNVKKLQGMFRDHLLDPTHRAALFAEFLMRHESSDRFLRRRSADLPWYQFLFLDIFLVIISVVIMLILGCYKGLKLLKVNKEQTFSVKNF